MVGSAIRRCCIDDAGSALVAVLVLLTVLTLTTGTVMLVYVIQHRFIQRDVHRLHARYAAEAGLHAALARLGGDVTWRAANEVVELPSNRRSTVSVASHGVFLLVVSKAESGTQRMTIRSVVGTPPPAEFDQAVVLGDPHGEITLAGSASITGDVTGATGVHEGNLPGRTFSGRHVGTVNRYAARALPPFDDAIPAETRGQFEAALARDERLGRSMEDVVEHFVDGDTELSTADSASFFKPVRIVATGDITLTGRLDFQPGSAFVAGGQIFVGGDVTGSDGLFYGRGGILIAEHVSCSGQFFSEGRIRIAGEAYLRYPSVLYIFDTTGRIEVEERAVVEGTLLYPFSGETSSSIAVGPAAVVRGSIYNTGRMELSGAVMGTVATHQFHFYESPTDYVNWLRDAVVDVHLRPAPFHVPPGFSKSASLQIVMLDERLTEIAR